MLIFISIFAILVYTDAVNASPLSAKKTNKFGTTIKDAFCGVWGHQLLMAKVSSEFSSIDLGGHKVDSIGQHVENIGGQHVEQPGTPQIEEHAHAVASTSESMDPKSQLEELLEMDEALMWEMAVRSEEEQITMSVRPEDLLITDLEDEPITDLEDEPITDLEVEQIIEEIQLEDELITDLEDDTEDDDLLQWFPTFIFMKLEKFLPNVPQGGGQHKAELTKLVESWKAEKQSIDIEHETVHVKEIENSLDTYREELRERIMTDVNNVTPAVLSTLLDQGIFDSHAEAKNTFLWKIVIQKPTHYVKNVGQFFGGIEIATAYLKQAVEIGQWARNNHFLTTAQLENLPKLVEQNLSELANLREAMAAKLGINLAKIEMPKLTSLENIFTRNLSEKHAETKDIAQREETKINDAQIAALHLLVALSAASAEVAALEAELLGIKITWRAFQTLHLLVALSAASAEVAALEAELLGIKITWRAFQTVGDVSKMAQILRQI
uniref:Secreted protein n=1 Tax=Globodera pallida TaxID=36090 RepID=A0A183CF78_GLOPA